MLTWYMLCKAASRPKQHCGQLCCKQFLRNVSNKVVNNVEKRVRPDQRNIIDHVLLFGEMFNQEDIVVAAACTIILSSIKKKRKRFWVRPSLQRRQTINGTKMLNDLNHDDVDPLSGELRGNGSFKNFARMTSADFENLINLVGHKIKKQDTNFRNAIPVKERLAITLRFLASGDSFQSLMYLFRISKQSISSIIPEVCEALINGLHNYVKMPKTEEEWKNIAKTFKDEWNFPLCLGSMDGKHIMIQAPIKSGTEFFNYKGFFSIVLFAVVDAQYNFLYINIGCQGRISDGGVFANTEFKHFLEECKLNLPSEMPLEGRQKKIPHVFVADDAFPLQQNIMKPYPGIQGKGTKKRIFNYRLSRARRVVENAFGIMSAVFRILRKPQLLEPESVKKTTLACVYLHNFLRRSSSKSSYTPIGTFDSDDLDTGNLLPGRWRSDQGEMTSFQSLRKVGKKPSLAAQEIRDEICDYFQTPEGKVSWQENY